MYPERILPSQPAILCKICGSVSHLFDQALILNQYTINYFKCSACHFIQTETPYWLEESYDRPIAKSDVGLVSRSSSSAQVTAKIISLYFNSKGKFIDYGCGYGLFVRMMRDKGFDFYGYDKYCQNLFSESFEADLDQKYELVTAFEVFEHFVEPLEEIEKLLRLSRNILFSTQLLPAAHPKPNDWWYYALHEGQHISLYTPQSLVKIAQRFNLNCYSDGSSFHLLTEKKLPQSLFAELSRINLSQIKQSSLVEKDYQKVLYQMNQTQVQNDFAESIAVKIIIDGVFFQISQTGIYRVWVSLLEKWVTIGFSEQILVLDRAGTAPKITGIQYQTIPAYDYSNTEKDRQILQQVCDQENADLFISTYYTTPLTTPSIFMAYDMIPERLGLDLNDPMWREKHNAIQHADAAISISENTAQDLIEYFPKFLKDSITVAHCGINSIFSEATSAEIQDFKSKYNISNPYFLLVGERVGSGGYKNTALFFKAFSQLANKFDREIICVGGSAELETDLKAEIEQCKVHLMRLSDAELKAAYSGAIALVYPSKYEGFGIPIIEAMACGCPVITCHNSAIKEVAERAVIYVKDDSVSELIQALEDVQKIEVRQSLVQASLIQAQKFSWSKMAEIVSSALIKNSQKLKSNSNSPSTDFNWQDFTYSKKSHLSKFRRFDYYSNIDLKNCDLKAYQDLLIYTLITEHLPPGSKLLEIGGGDSRVIQALKQNYECWNLDKLEGVGNGPKEVREPSDYHLVQDYIGNFNSELPENYFDCIFSISTLEHIPEDETHYQNISQDINRLLKPGGWSFHCFDIILKFQAIWTNDFLSYLFEKQATLHQQISFDRMQQDPDLYTMSELAYNRYWRHLTKMSYEDFGKPVSYNVFWQKPAAISSSPQVLIRQSLPKISIVTPSLNQAKFLEECIDSVLSQGYPNLEYLIMDGGSHDGSVEIIKKYEKYLRYWQSQPDGGHYAAVNSGLNRTTGEVMAWLNSDDKYHPDALFKVATVFTQNQQIEWMTGTPTEWDRNGQRIQRQTPVPAWSRKILLEKQAVRQNPQLQHLWIQQESTFWHRNLWQKAGSKLHDNLQFAGDFELWLRFSRYAPLYRIQALIGGFRISENQRSQVYREQYFKEVEQMIQEELKFMQQGFYTSNISAPAMIQLSEDKVLAAKNKAQTVKTFKVSALVSTYNAEQQMRGRLENLVHQTLFQKGQLEIIIINSGSLENEREIVEEFKQKYSDKIIDIQTPKRETIYSAWNRGIEQARGQYITNQNTDDRMKSTSLEYLSSYLDQQDNVVLVHGDQQAVAAGESFDVENLTGQPYWQWSQFSKFGLLFLAQVGSQPMWRKSLHDKYGLFDPELKVRGDQDFYLRISNAGEFHFLPEVLGTLNLTSTSLSHNQELSKQEEINIFRRYTSRENIEKLMNVISDKPLTDEQYQALVNDLCCELVEDVLDRFKLPFYIGLVTDLLQLVIPLGLGQKVIQTNIIRILNRFADQSTRSQVIGSWNQSILKDCTQQIEATGESLEKINLSVHPQKFGKMSLLNAENISPVSHNLSRPFWSVMIPTYNGKKYLENTLKSLLSQAISPEEMQIEVVDDCSTEEGIEELVQQVAGNRITFDRNPQNLGLINNWNECIKRARGEWIHILHQDDIVLPGFYSRLRELLEKEPNAGAGFCRHYYIDEQGQQRALSILEQEEAGIIPNWIEKISVMQRVQFASIVVKRSVYEALGGFCQDVGSAADWEMWKRIAAHYPVVFEPQPLAGYRLHSTSESSRLVSTGTNISDTRKSIEISQSYLPAEKAQNLSNQALEHYALYALNTAQTMLSQGEHQIAITQIQEALKCSQSSQVKEGVIHLFSTTIETQAIEPKNILAEVAECVEQYRQNSNQAKVLEQLQKLRQSLAKIYLNTPLEKLESVYNSELGQAYKTLLNSGIKNESLTEIERSSVDQWINYLSQGMNQSHALQHLFATMLYVYPHHLPPQWYQQAPIPKWFVNDYLIFMLATPDFFQVKGEAQRYYLYMKDWVDYLHSRIFSDPDSKTWQDIANLFLHRANFIPLYFNSENLKDLYIKRAEIFELALKSQGHPLDYTFPERPKNRSKIRLGILSSHFNPQTETYATLPVFEYLDRTQFEIILYACQANNHALEQYCKSRADQFIKLPKNLEEQVKTIRADNLDILLIATNVTAVTHLVTLLALHRLARIQVASTPSCVTTGMQNIDYYISGNLTEPPEIAPTQYREQLVTIAGPAHCFSYAESSSQHPKVNPQRSDLGLSENTVVFISGANFYKIIPELRETWAKILTQVSNSVLVLYPFNPNWTSNYAKMPFLKNLQAVFASYGIDPQRLIILDTQASRADIKAYLKLADIYLDSYPFSGVTSLVDPLEVGLVPVTKDGNSFRSRMGAALLRSLSLSSLITTTEDAYISLAVQLANTLELRQQTQQQIQQKMKQNPSFLESQTYSSKIEAVLQKLFQNWQYQHQPKNSIELETLSGKRDFLAELVSYVNLYDINPFTQTLVEHLRYLRKVLADYWLKIPPHQLEEVYQDHMGQGYQILLHRGIQKEALTPSEQKFVDELTQVATGLQHPNALNCLMAAMLYYVPGKMLVREAEKRLPQWFINDYKTVFENQEIVENIQQSNRAIIYKKLTESPTKNKFKNRVLGCVNLYRIDPGDQSVLEELRQIRQQFAQFWLSLAPTELESIYKSSVGEAYQSLLQSGFQQQSLTEIEQQFLQQLTKQLNQGFDQPQTVNYFLAFLLYSQPEPLKVEEISKLPQWLYEIRNVLLQING